MRRRDLITGMTALGFFSLLNPEPLSWALRPRSPDQSEQPNHFLVFISVWGAMDVTLGLDPWLAPVLPDPRDMFIEYRQDDLIEADHGILVGPAAGFLKKYRGQFSIVNGLFMAESDLGVADLKRQLLLHNFG